MIITYGLAATLPAGGSLNKYPGCRFFKSCEFLRKEFGVGNDPKFHHYPAGKVPPGRHVLHPHPHRNGSKIEALLNLFLSVSSLTSPQLRVAAARETSTSITVDREARGKCLPSHDSCLACRGMRPSNECSRPELRHQSLMARNKEIGGRRT